jgi:23S rRNA pseudouridine955/2504/2580 synthase
MEKIPHQQAQNNLQKQSAHFVEVTSAHAGQRIDNFLMRELKDVPKSYIYRILRKGEVRVNKKRIKQTYKLLEGDTVRIPPVFLPEKQTVATAPESLLKSIEASIILEDDDLIFINKPSGMAVHGGSGVRYGLIESFRQLRPKMPFIELVHRLDKETSGIVMLAKNRHALLELHTLLKAKSEEGGIEKYYQTLIKGQWRGGERHIKNNLQREQGRKQKVRVVDDASLAGKVSESIFTPITKYPHHTLMKVKLMTGRMHQIRTQLAELGHPILGDSQYGDFTMNREVKKLFGLKRMFLHAYHLKFTLASSGKRYNCQIPLPDDLNSSLEKIKDMYGGEYWHADI